VTLFVGAEPVTMIFTGGMMLVEGRVLNINGMSHMDLNGISDEQMVMKRWRDRIRKANSPPS
jgi:hypothetical protein